MRSLSLYWCGCFIFIFLFLFATLPKTPLFNWHFFSHIILVQINYLIYPYLDAFLSTNNIPPNKFLMINRQSKRGDGICHILIYLVFLVKVYWGFFLIKQERGLSLFVFRGKSFVNDALLRWKIYLKKNSAILVFWL